MVDHGRGGGYGLGGLLSLCGQTGEMAISRIRFEDEGTLGLSYASTHQYILRCSYMRDIPGHPSGRLQTRNHVHAYWKHDNIMTSDSGIVNLGPATASPNPPPHCRRISGRSSHNSIFSSTNQTSSISYQNALRHFQDHSKTKSRIGLGRY